MLGGDHLVDALALLPDDAEQPLARVAQQRSIRVIMPAGVEQGLGRGERVDEVSGTILVRPSDVFEESSA